MVGLAARADFAAFHFDEIANVYVAMQNRVGPEPREGADPAVVGD